MNKAILKLAIAGSLGSTLIACAGHNQSHYGTAHHEKPTPRLVYQQPQQQPAPRNNAPSYQNNHSSDAFPPDPRPGECYARVKIPAKFTTTEKRIIAKEASDRIQIIPAKYTTTQKRVLVEEASTRLKVIPATYTTTQERVLVTPPRETVVEIPATYRTVSERVLDKPARTEWKRGTGIGVGKASSGAYTQSEVRSYDGQKVLNTRVEDTGEVMCLVEVPATYKTITRKVLVNAATTRTSTVPGKYKTITRRVVQTPARTQTIDIPAKYKTITTTEIATPAQEKRIPIPAQYKTVTQKQQVRPESLEWRPVLCEVNMTPANIRELQSSLKREGCYKCNIDGVMGPCTIQAAQCYARPRSLPAGNKYISLDVIRSLGLNLQQN